jgi:hypothetical protein
MKTTITWINAEIELPKRDVPVLVLATSGKQTWVQASHRMSRGWSTISKPGVVRYWAAFPSAPTIVEDENTTL